MVDLLTESARLQPNVSVYRKGHSTTTTFLAIRDDIPKAMNRGEVTIAVMEDFSKAFDTVVYETFLCKLRKLGFSKSSLHYTLNQKDLF